MRPSSIDLHCVLGNNIRDVESTIIYPLSWVQNLKVYPTWYLKIMIHLKHTKIFLWYAYLDFKDQSTSDINFNQWFSLTITPTPFNNVTNRAHGRIQFYNNGSSTTLNTNCLLYENKLEKIKKNYVCSPIGRSRIPTHHTNVPK